MLLWWHGWGNVCVGGWRCTWMCECVCALPTPCSLVLCLSSSSQPPSPCRERACWVTAVWSSPGLAPDLLSLPSCLSPTVPLPASPPLTHQLPLLPAGSFTQDWYGFVCVSGHACLFPTAHKVQLLVYLSCSQWVLGLSFNPCGLNLPVKPLRKTDLESVLSQQPGTSALTFFLLISPF